MEMQLRRRWAEGDATIGELALSIDGERFCYTLEDQVRAPGVKIPGKTAIPAGRYRAIVTFSNRFKRELPLLLNVPMFDGIRLHGGNVAADTEGCILVGLVKGAARISNCAPAVEALIEHIVLANAVGSCWVTVEDIA